MEEYNVEQNVDETEFVSDDSDEYELDIDCNFGLNADKRCELRDPKTTHSGISTKLTQEDGKNENITMCCDTMSLNLQPEEKVMTCSGERNPSILANLQMSLVKDNSGGRSHAAGVSTGALDSCGEQSARDTVTDKYLVPVTSGEVITRSTEFVQVATNYLKDKIKKLQQDDGQNQDEISKLRGKIQQMQTYDETYTDIVKMCNGNEKDANRLLSEAMVILLRSCEDVGLPASYIDQEFDKIIKNCNHCSASLNQTDLKGSEKNEWNVFDLNSKNKHDESHREERRTKLTAELKPPIHTEIKKQFQNTGRSVPLESLLTQISKNNSVE